MNRSLYRFSFGFRIFTGQVSLFLDYDRLRQNVYLVFLKTVEIHVHDSVSKSAFTMHL